MEATTDIKREALKNGAIWGIINLVIFLFVWYVMPTLVGNWVYGVLTVLIGIGLAIFFTLDLRKKVGKYWSFGEALWTIFAMFLMAMAITFVFNILFGKYIDPNYPIKMKEAIMENSKAMFEKLGMAADQIEEAMVKQSEKADSQLTPTFSQAVVGFGISAVIYFVGALIFALIFKKTNPNPFAPQQEELTSN